MKANDLIKLSLNIIDFSISGIYCIYNSISNKIYIGQTKNIKNRWAIHKALLRKNKHTNSHLQNAWNKYGENSFNFLVLETCKKGKLNEKEEKWASLIERNSLYNLSAVGKTVETSEMIKEKISLSKKGTFGVVANTGKRSIDIKTANLIREYIMKGNSITDTAKYFNINHGTVRGIVLGKLYILDAEVDKTLLNNCIDYMKNYKSCRNKSFKHTEESKKKMKEDRKGKNNYERRKLTDEQVNKLREKYILGSSFAQLSREFGLIPQSIRRVILGEIYKNGKSISKYYEEKAVEIYNKSKNS